MAVLVAGARQNMAPPRPMRPRRNVTVAVLRTTMGKKSISNWGLFLASGIVTRNVEIRAVLLPAVADVLFHVWRHLEHVRKDLRRQFLVFGWFVVFLWPLYA